MNGAAGMHRRDFLKACGAGAAAMAARSRPSSGKRKANSPMASPRALPSIHPRYLLHSIALVASIHPVFPTNAPPLLGLFGLKQIL